MNTEIELKLEFQPAELARFRRWKHLSRLTHGPVKRACMQAQYFDTIEHDLKNQKAALRIRREFGNIVQTFKKSLGEGVIQRRTELNFPLKKPLLDLAKLQDETESRDIFRGLTDTPLFEVFRTKIWRTVRLLQVSGSEIELVIDSGTIYSNDRVAAVSEVELELLNGDPETLLSIAENWKEQFEFKLGGPSKAERGYGLANS